jgi:alkylhydroperoxidase family enzyme
MREDMLSTWKEEDMAHIEGITRSHSLLVRLVFFFSRRCYGRVIKPARVYALHPRLLLAVGHMEEVQEGARQLGASVKHLARMLVAWCLDFGTRASQDLLIAGEQLRALPDYEHSRLFSEEERAVLRYADAMTTIPVQVPGAVFTALQAIYTDRQILELTTAIAWENYHARVNHALGLEAEGMARHVCLVPMHEELRDQPAHADA